MTPSDGPATPPSRPAVRERNGTTSTAPLALVVAEGLVELGVLNGSPETLVESGAATLFFPHGVGHLVGLGVRDTGQASDEARDTQVGLPRLRVDITLQPRQAWTVEPGIYVVPALLSARTRPR